jgi:endoglucanase
MEVEMIPTELMRRYPFFAGLNADYMATLAKSAVEFSEDEGYCFSNFDFRMFAMKLRLSIVVFGLLLAACSGVNQDQVSDTDEAIVPVKVASITPAPSATPRSSPTTAPSLTPTQSSLKKLQVIGNRIVIEDGNPLVLRGLAHVDPVEQALLEDAFGPWKEDTYRVMSEWGANVVRIPLVPDSWQIAPRDQALEVLDQTIGWAGKYDMYVIIDFHSIGFPPDDFYTEPEDETTTEDIRDFWSLISRRYAGNDTVAFYEIFNEPLRSSDKGVPTLEAWEAWKEYCEEVIDLIRQNDPDTIVIVGGLQAAYDLSFVSQVLEERSNIAYATHPYPAVTWNKNWDTAFGNVADQYPIIATEFGFNNDSQWSELTEAAYEGSGGRYRHAIIDYLEAHEISWVVLGFSHVWDPTLLLNTNYSPTESGEFFREQLLSLNK